MTGYKGGQRPGPGAASQGMLGQVAGGLHVPELIQVEGEGNGGEQGAGVVGA